MKMLINRPESVVEEMVEGLVALHPGFRRLPGQTVIVRADAEAVRDRQVALISGGGSGHEPAHAGYVGRGMLSAAVAGDVFTSPSPDAVLAAIRAVAGKPGAVLIVKNYTGDRLNFGLAAEMARAEGIPVEIVVVADDVALPESEHTAGPRGLAGTVLVHKVAGASAEAGASLAEVATEARATAAAVKTMGVALSACTVPAAGKPGFVLDESEVELGLGIHGEPGVRRAPLEPADALVDHLLETILGRFSTKPARVALLVNGLGGTTAMELAIVARRAVDRLREAGESSSSGLYAGTFLSALEMAGVSLSVLEAGRREARKARRPDRRPRLAQRRASIEGRAESGRSPRRRRVRPGCPEPPQTTAGRTLGVILQKVAESLIADSSRLNDLDQAVGDGDIGVSLARGARATIEAIPSFPLDDPAATLHALSVLLQRSLGGTSGPLYAMALLRASARLREGPRRLGRVPSRPVAGIAEVGGAKPGDRTMLDALIPASEALAASLQGRTIRPPRPWPKPSTPPRRARRRRPR